ncbi:MAG: GNAT family N-acetyltransferase [Actinomycetes bacterium]
MPPVPLLHAGRYLLRAWTPDDLDFVLAAARDEQIGRYSSVGTSVDRAAALRWISSRHSPDRLDWVVEHSGIPIGRVSLAHIDYDDQVAEVGYWVLPDHRRQGVASTAVEAAEMHAFNDVGIVRLFIRHEPDNVASCALADSRGYQPEGVQRGAFTRAGARRDLHVHGLLATDGQ